RQAVLSRLHLQPMLHFVEGGVDRNDLFFAISADCVIVFEAEADGVNEAVAGGGWRIGKSGLQHLTGRERVLIGGRGPRWGNPGGGRRYDLAEEMFTNKKPALGG